jgi:hypothetical protein
MRGAITPFPNTPSWRGAQSKHRDKFTFYGENGNMRISVKSGMIQKADSVHSYN